MLPVTQKERNLLKRLAAEYRAISTDAVQDQRRKAWTELNGLITPAPQIYARAFAWDEMPGSQLESETPLARQLEQTLKYRIFWNSLEDDSIFEDFLLIRAIFRCTGWGYRIERHTSEKEKGSFKVDYPIREWSDLEQFRAPVHAIDEEATEAVYCTAQEIFDGGLELSLDRSPAYQMWTGDISTDLGYLRGIENIMLDVMDEPEHLKKLVSMLADGILATHLQADAAGDWNLAAHCNQAMPYAPELAPPRASTPAKKKELWGFMASQEFTLMSPAQFEEFLLAYQKPILAGFGLVAYGCCEDLTNKIGLLKEIPNLRRIAVSPFADVEKCVAQINRDYVISYRPSPALLLGCNWRENLRRQLKKDFELLKGCYFDITLKDIETLEHDSNRMREAIRIIRENLV